MSLEGLLQGIASSPRDDDLWLILADWLEERGDPRGEFVRVQCALAGMDEYDSRREELARREAELLRQHGEVWRGRPPREIDVRFQRGLLLVRVQAEELAGQQPAPARLLAAAARLGVFADVLARDQAAQWFMAQQSWVSELQLWSVADEFLQRLVARGLLAHVVALTVDYGSLTDAGLLHLAGLTQLQKLDLGQTRVRDTDVEHLAGLTQLRWLNLRDSRVTDAGLEYLTGLTQLRWLWLGGASVTDAGVEKLQQALPDCRIDNSLR